MGELLPTFCRTSMSLMPCEVVGLSSRDSTRSCIDREHGTLDFACNVDLRETFIQLPA